MSSIEGFLTRELNIRFIDARQITNEAKIALGIEGYPSKSQMRALRHQALAIFETRPSHAKDTMRQLSGELDAVKARSSAHAHPQGSLSDKEDSSSSDDNSISSKARRGWL